MDKTRIKFERTLDQLRNPDAGFTAEAIYSLSDLYGEHLTQFRALWPTMSDERRENLITRLVETAETNFDLDFSTILYMALDDAAAGVRRAAVDGIMEDSPIRVIERLLVMAQSDSSNEVRAAALQTLGTFILLGEFGKLPDTLNDRLQEAVLAIHSNPKEPLDVRRRALEAISNCGREGVLDLIRTAYYTRDMAMRVSAVYAMGRSCDDVWAPQVIEELSSDNAEMRYEAVRAAGELELKRALPRLVELAYDEDREIQEAAVWSLGEIGGKAALNALERLADLAEEREDDDLAEAVHEAQDAAQLANDSILPLFDFNELDDEDEDEDEFDEDDEYDEDELAYFRGEDGGDLDDEDDDFDGYENREEGEDQYGGDYRY
ncbi:MAG TPA: HEAT repeat domain-containing protein [Aggregatilineaceae bacterium]|nr:HEAT repeat domain-containing protein [Aggregatilineaceae bacterium]